MGERKVLNKYIPPDFDPSIIPKFKRTRDKLMEIRMMLPFSLRCNTCGEYMYRGKKFNSKKEDITDDTYMGIRKIRFYIKCTACSAEITFKTDPKNSDYECESGASRNFELWRDNTATIEEETKQREEEDKYDAMKSLEHRTMDNKVEMDILDALDEIKSINSRHRKVDTEKVLNAINARHNTNSVKTDSLTAEDEELIKSIKFRQTSQSSSNNNNVPTHSHSDDVKSDTIMKEAVPTTSESFMSQLAKQSQSQSQSQPILPTVLIKRKRKIEETIPITPVESNQSNISSNSIPLTVTATDESDKVPQDRSSEANAPVECDDGEGGGLFGLLGDYGDDEDDA